jgi:hypothetical protein
MVVAVGIAAVVVGDDVVFGTFSALDNGEFGGDDWTDVATVGGWLAHAARNSSRHMAESDLIVCFLSVSQEVAAVKLRFLCFVIPILLHPLPA